MHSRKNSVKLFCMCALCGLYPFPVSVSDFTDFFKNRHNSIKLCWNMSKKMPRLNNDEWNQAIAVCQQMLYHSTLVVLERLSSIYRDDYVSQETLPTVLEVVGHMWPLLQMIAISSCCTYVTGVWLQKKVWYSSRHSSTVKNRLRQNVQPIHVYRPYFGQILTWRHRTARRDWCCRHLHFRRADWDLILFSDECQFNLSHAEGRERVYRRRVEHFANACVIELDHFGGVSVLVWGGIVGGNRTCL